MRNDSRLLQAQHHGAVLSCKFRVCAVLDGIYHDGIAINFHHDHDVLVASFLSGGELTSLFRKHCVADVIDFSVDVSHLLT